MTKTYVLYHGFAKDGKGIAGCYDGFGAAFAAYKKLGDTAEYVPVAYGQAPPAMQSGSLVYIVDFSYSREVLLDLAETHHKVTVLDHHKTAQEALKDLEHPNLDITFDMERSGAALTWDHFHPDAEVPWLIKFIEDRDLWRFKLPGSLEMHTILQSYHFDFEDWESIYQSLEMIEGRESMIQEGRAVVRFRDMQVEHTCEQAVLKTVCGHAVPVCNATGMWSEVGHKLLELFPQNPFAVSYFIRADGIVQLSIRSRKDFDCSPIAKQFGGGGHAQASGAEISLEKFQELMTLGVPHAD